MAKIIYPCTVEHVGPKYGTNGSPTTCVLYTANFAFSGLTRTISVVVTSETKVYLERELHWPPERIHGFYQDTICEFLSNEFSLAREVGNEIVIPESVFRTALAKYKNQVS